MKKILKLAEALSKLRAEEKEIKEKLAPVKEKKLTTQEKLVEAMKEMGLKSIKTETHNFARVVKRDIAVYDQGALIKALKKNGMERDYVHEQVDVLRFKGYAKQLLKTTGELLDGTEPTESEYMSIKAAK
jgi:hypothetical protein